MTIYPPELIQNLPIQIIQAWRSPKPRPWNEQELIEDIKKNGITDPIEIGIGVWSRKARLDTGNHRIYIAPQLGITHIPCICRVSNYAVFNTNNGDHAYDTPWILKKQEWIEEEYLAKPDTVLDIMKMLLDSDLEDKEI